MIAAGFVSIRDAGADQGSCVLQATNTDVFVIVYDIFVKVQPLRHEGTKKEYEV